jgi:hypothetical protein
MISKINIKNKDIIIEGNYGKNCSYYTVRENIIKFMDSLNTFLKKEKLPFEMVRPPLSDIERVIIDSIEKYKEVSFEGLKKVSGESIETLRDIIKGLIICGYIKKDTNNAKNEIYIID